MRRAGRLRNDAAVTRALGLAVVVVLCGASLVLAQVGGQFGPPAGGGPEPAPGRFDLGAQLQSLRDAALSLPIAAALGAILAFRPRQRGTPPRSAPVIQTQIVLAVVGAVVMLVVGASLARAFGIVGAASLIRYRAKIDDPKDAVVMLSTLGIGLASGVGLYSLAVFATLFILALLWSVESFEPEPKKLFHLTVSIKDPLAFQPKLEKVLNRFRVDHEFRSSAENELVYEVELPYGCRIEPISNAILRLDGEQKASAVEWDEKKPKSRLSGV